MNRGPTQKSKVGPNRMTVYTPYPRYAVYPVPYMTLSHRFRNRMTVYGFWPTVYTPYVRSKPPYMDRICRWCRVRFPATAIFFAFFGQISFLEPLFPELFLCLLFYWCMCFALIIIFIGGYGSWTPLCTEKVLFWPFWLEASLPP